MNTIGGATGLGSNLAEVQNDQFLKLVHKDIRKIEKAMTKIAVYTAKSIGIADPKIDFKFVMD